MHSIIKKLDVDMFWFYNTLTANFDDRMCQYAESRSLWTCQERIVECVAHMVSMFEIPLYANNHNTIARKQKKNDQK